MKDKRCTGEQIGFALHRAQMAARAVEVCGTSGTTEQPLIVGTEKTLNNLFFRKQLKDVSGPVVTRL